MSIGEFNLIFSKMGLDPEPVYQLVKRIYAAGGAAYIPSVEQFKERVGEDLHLLLERYGLIERRVLCTAEDNPVLVMALTEKGSSLASDVLWRDLSVLRSSLYVNISQRFSKKLVFIALLGGFEGGWVSIKPPLKISEAARHIASKAVNLSIQAEKLALKLKDLMTRYGYASYVGEHEGLGSLILSSCILDHPAIAEQAWQLSQILKAGGLAASPRDFNPSLDDVISIPPETVEFLFDYTGLVNLEYECFLLRRLVESTGLFDEKQVNSVAKIFKKPCQSKGVPSMSSEELLKEIVERITARER